MSLEHSVIILQGGELYSYLRRCGKLGEEQVLFYACQVGVSLLCRVIDEGNVYLQKKIASILSHLMRSVGWVMIALVRWRW